MTWLIVEAKNEKTANKMAAELNRKDVPVNGHIWVTENQPTISNDREGMEVVLEKEVPKEAQIAKDVIRAAKQQRTLNDIYKLLGK